MTSTVIPVDSGSVMLKDGKTPAANWYDAAQSLDLYAVPLANYRFSYWWGDLRGRTDRMNLTMDRPHSIMAYFKDPKTGAWDWWNYRE